MASITPFFKKLFKPEAPKCIFEGLDAVGKTSLLYTLKLGQIVTTIPTIGFNVEEISVRNKKLVCWDIGGGDKIRPLLRHYYHQETAILFMFDGSDPWRFQEALDELCRQLDECQSLGSLLFAGIWIGKQDLPQVTQDVVKDMEERIRRAITNQVKLTVPWRIYSHSGLNSLDKRHHEDIFEDIIDNIENARKDRKKEKVYLFEKDKPTDTEIQPMETKRNTTSNFEYQLEQGRKHAEVPGKLFFDYARDGKITSWTQYVKIRAIYLLLLKCLEEPSSIASPQTVVFLVVPRYQKLLHQLKEQNISTISQSQLVPHQTLDTFWVYQVYLTFIDHFKEINAIKDGGYFAIDMFYYYCQYPHLLDELLWKDFYTSELILDGLSEKNWYLPNLQPLPPMPTLIESGPDPSLPAKAYGSDDYLDEISAVRIKRWAYATLQRVKMTGERRGKVVSEGLEQFKMETMRARVKDTSIQPFSETHCYFWIQMIHSGIEHLEREDKSFDMTKMGYSTFELLFPDALASSVVWKEYYTEDRWKSVESRMHFKTPNKGKAAPNVFVVDSKKKKKQEESRSRWDHYLMVDPPSFEELNERRKTILFEVGKIRAAKEKALDLTAMLETEAELSSGAVTPGSEAGDEDWEDLGIKTTKSDGTNDKASSIKASHSEVQDHANIEEALAKKLAKISVLQTQPNKTAESVKQEPTPDTAINSPILSHAELLDMIFSHFQLLSYTPAPITASSTKKPTTASSDSIKDADVISPITKVILDTYSDKIPISMLIFWTRRVVEAICETSGTLKRPDYTLAEFLEKNPELAWNDLWLLYYTELTWWSHDAKTGLVMADRRNVRGYIKKMEVV